MTVVNRLTTSFARFMFWQRNRFPSASIAWPIGNKFRATTCKTSDSIDQEPFRRMFETCYLFHIVSLYDTLETGLLFAQDPHLLWALSSPVMAVRRINGGPFIPHLSLASLKKKAGLLANARKTRQFSMCLCHLPSPWQTTKETTHHSFKAFVCKIEGHAFFGALKRLLKSSGDPK